MRATPRYTQQAPARRYSVVEICAMVEDGAIMARSIPDRIRMKQILKANAEAQHAYGLNAGYAKQKMAHYEMEQKLLKYRSKITLKDTK